MKNKSTKKTLFERMEYLDPDFKKPLNENLDREQMMEALEKKFNLHHIDTAENFYGQSNDGSNNSGIWISGEGGETASDGYPLFDYWAGSNEKYTFGVHNEFQEFCEENGWYPEWHDAGTLMVWED